MCRLAAFFGGFSRIEAIDVLLGMEGSKTGHGIGISYVKDGKFIVRKYLRPLPELLKHGIPILSHMPDHQGVTLVHSRKASCGQVDKDNIHPFLSPFDDPKYCIAHNGYFSPHRTVELCLGDKLSYPGNTDSAAGAHLISMIGMKRFFEEYENIGVWFSINLKGELEIFKSNFTSDLELTELSTGQWLIASELDNKKYKRLSAFEGYYKFNADGTNKTIVRKEYKTEWFQNQNIKIRLKNKIGGELGTEWRYQQNMGGHHHGVYDGYWGE